MSEPTHRSSERKALRSASIPKEPKARVLASSNSKWTVYPGTLSMKKGSRSGITLVIDPAVAASSDYRRLGVAGHGQSGGGCLGPIAAQQGSMFGRHHAASYAWARTSRSRRCVNYGKRPACPAPQEIFSRRR